MASLNGDNLQVVFAEKLLRISRNFAFHNNRIRPAEQHEHSTLLEASDLRFATRTLGLLRRQPPPNEPPPLMFVGDGSMSHGRHKRWDETRVVLDLPLDGAEDGDGWVCCKKRCWVVGRQFGVDHVLGAGHDAGRWARCGGRVLHCGGGHGDFRLAVADGCWVVVQAAPDEIVDERFGQDAFRLVEKARAECDVVWTEDARRCNEHERVDERWVIRCESHGDATAK